ncbi:unnamed protein product [Adineta steineri]|uniref:Rab3 GTPase-activating protein catalytic subunit n=1 Tax=Adineta steineri TaxID=433720 RepID=A0A815LYZ8_9BILA|nr:unnamed protein product [Adineta steineri]CAF1619210.1 unnamed protein product [Adineta steineri]
MTTVKEDEDIFEIVDYTTASDWERFIARIEEILSEWKLNGPEMSNTEVDFADGEWIEHNEALEFGDHSYTITHFSLQIPESTSLSTTEINPQMTTSVSFEKQTFIPPRAMADMMSRRNDFPSRSPYLSHWYGLREFIILAPKRNNDAVTDEDRANLLLSSTAIAVSNVGCNVPIFIRVQHEWRNMFIGLCEGSGLRTHFNICHLKNAPHQYRHLAGLLEIFKSKLGANISNDTIVMVAVRFTYVLKEFESTTSRQALPRDEAGMPVLTDLPFGSLYDPVSGLHLSCTWPIFSEELVTENDDCNDFDPLLSQQWAIGVTLLDDLPVLLTEAVQEYLKLSTQRESIEQLLGKIQTNDELTNNSTNMADPIKRISDSRTQQYWTSFSSSISNTTNRLRVNIFNPPLPPSVVEKTIEYLFNERPTLSRQRSLVEEYPENTERIRQLKSVPKDSFVYRLVVCFAAICSLPSYNHLRSIAHIWFDVVQELRTHWETGKLIPGLESGSPNLSFSKFYQNLQMLNCCIEHRLRHENDTTTVEEQQQPPQPQPQPELDEDGDEFYECSSTVPLSKSNLSELQPDGRLKPCGDLKLLYSNDILYIPITQECPPATEDMLDEQTIVLTSLGSGEEATLLRAKMQSRSLLSDMESFKAANPLGTIEDFVRWYSPRDWIEIEEIDKDGNMQKSYSLSQRMQLPDNLWMEVWQQARPISVRRQKRLFDDGKEAEKILQKLSSLSPGEILEQLIPVLLHVVYDRITKNIEDMEEQNSSVLFETFYAKSVLLVKGKDERKKKLQQDYIECLTVIEQHMCRFQSFKEKLFPSDLNQQEKEEMTRFAIELHTRPEMPVKGAANSRLGKKLASLFATSKPLSTQGSNNDLSEVKNQFMTPAGKEYILRASIARPSQSRSRPSPQRMYCMLAQDEFRLCGAFSEDTTFF